ncbi:MAG: YqzL family protein [Clostridia bacterium]|nr:YqzL family protein [Clostridia bacterium]
MKQRDKDAAELAWKMFQKTGKVSYYMLYKELNGK